jgi:tRNA(fMet)-specific endonuclease VapC
MTFLLDTSTMIFASISANKSLERKIIKNTKKIFLCSPSVAEFLQGTYSLPKGNNRHNELRLFQDMFGHFPILSFDESASHEFAKIHAEMKAKKAQPPGQIDIMIAAIARTRSMVVVTDNIKDFKKIPRLKIENWI